jgi:PEP-CTERM motif
LLPNLSLRLDERESPTVDSRIQGGLRFGLPNPLEDLLINLLGAVKASLSQKGNDMYTRLSLASLALVFCLFSAAAVKADEIAVWNFNDSNLIVDRGMGTLTTTANPANILFLEGTTFAFNPMGDPAGMALAFQAGANLQNNGMILELHASTLGYTNITVSWAWQRSDTGFNDDVIQESADGTTFQGFSFASIQTNFWGGHHSSFGAGSPFENNPNFAVRITLSGATSETGTVRFDNIVVTGTKIVPEPATMLLLVGGLAGVAAEVRRRRRARR